MFWAALPFFQWIRIAFATLILYPSYKLYKQYRLTHIIEYMLFSGVFLLTFLALYMDALAYIYDILIFYQLNWIAFNTAYFFFYVIAVRMIRERPTSIGFIIASVWYVLLNSMIIFWSVYEQPDVAKVIIMDMKVSYTTYHSNGAGLVINGITVYSTSHRILGDLFMIYCGFGILWSFISVQPMSSQPRILLGRKIWISAAITGIIVWTISLPLGVYTEVINVLAFFVVAQIAYIALRIPETLLISRYQLIRAAHLYKQIFSPQPSKTQSEEVIVQYLGSLPSFVFEKPVSD